VSAPLEMTVAYKLNTEDEDLIGIEPSPQKRSTSSISTPALGVIYLCGMYNLDSGFIQRVFYFILTF